MAKKPISWYEHSLKNSEAHASEKLEAIKRALVEASRLIDGNAFLRAQIAEAKRRGLTEFDRDRLLVKRTKEAGEQEKKLVEFIRSVEK